MTISKSTELKIFEAQQRGDSIYKAAKDNHIDYKTAQKYYAKHAQLIKDMADKIAADVPGKIEKKAKKLLPFGLADALGRAVAKKGAVE